MFHLEEIDLSAKLLSYRGMYDNISYKIHFFFGEKISVTLATYVFLGGCTQGRIYYEANEASASGPHHLGGPHQNFNAVLKADFSIL